MAAPGTIGWKYSGEWDPSTVDYELEDVSISNHVALVKVRNASESSRARVPRSRRPFTRHATPDPAILPLVPSQDAKAEVVQLQERLQQLSNAAQLGGLTPEVRRRPLLF